MRKFLIASALSATIIAATAAAAEENAAPPPTPTERLAALRREIVPDAGPVRPPYDLARHDFGMHELFPQAPPPKAIFPNITTLLEVEAAFESEMPILRKAARERQERLTALWTKLRRKTEAADLDKNAKADFALLDHAFGTGELKTAKKAAEKSGPVAELRLARLLLAECDFDSGLKILVRLAGFETDTQKEATRLLLKLEREYRELIEGLPPDQPLLPPALNIGEVLSAKAPDVIMKANLILLEKEVRPAPFFCYKGWRDADTTHIRIGGDNPHQLFYSLGVRSKDKSVADERGANQSPAAGRENVEPSQEIKNTPVYVKRGWILSKSEEKFAFATQSQVNDIFPLNSFRRAEIPLETAHNGEIEFKIRTIPSKSDWLDFPAADYAALPVAARWTQTFHPLTANNSEATKADVQLPLLPEGYYALTARARYSPLTAVQQFIVNDAFLYLRATRRHILVLALNLRDGKPLSDAELILTADPYRKCLNDKWQKIAGIPVKWNRMLGLNEIRTGKDEAHYYAEQRVKTRADGAAVASFCQTKPTGLMELDVERKNPAWVRTGLTFQEHTTALEPRFVVWTDNQYYYPGEEVKFKGFVHLGDDEHSASAPDNKIIVGLGTTHIRLARTVTLSPTGGFSGTLVLPQNIASDRYFIYAGKGTKITAAEWFIHVVSRSTVGTVPKRDIQSSKATRKEQSGDGSTPPAAPVSQERPAAATTRIGRFSAPERVETCEGKIAVEVKIDRAEEDAQKKFTLLVVAENSQNLWHRILVTRNVIERIKVPLSPDFSPGFRLTAVLFKDGIAEEVSTEVEVPPLHRKLKIRLDQREISEGKNVRVTGEIQVRDWKGRPVHNAEVFVAAGMSEQFSKQRALQCDLWAYLFKRPFLLYTEANFSVPLTVHYPETFTLGAKPAWLMLQFDNPITDVPLGGKGVVTAVGLGGGRGGAFGFRERLPKKPLTPPAYWGPSLITDKHGRVSFEFTVPAGPPTWCVFAAAATADSRFGSATLDLNPETKP